MYRVSYMSWLLFFVGLFFPINKCFHVLTVFCVGGGGRVLDFILGPLSSYKRCSQLTCIESRIFKYRPILVAGLLLCLF